MKLIRITETPNEDGTFTRALAFEEPEKRIGDSVSTAPVIKTYEFPPDRASIIIDDKLYDWYGREVKLGEGIQRIVQPFGGVLTDDGVGFETFVVELESGRLTLARLLRDDQPIVEMPSYYKAFLAGPMSNRASSLRIRSCYTFAKENTDIRDTPVFKACMNNVKHWSEVRVLCDVLNRNEAIYEEEASEDFMVPWQTSPMTVFREVFENGTSWIRSNFVGSRDEILSATEEEPKHGWANYVVGELTVSEDGLKMSAQAPWKEKDGSRRRVSTDVVVLNHVGHYDISKSRRIYWYYDD